MFVRRGESFALELAPVRRSASSSLRLRYLGTSERVSCKFRLSLRSVADVPGGPEEGWTSEVVVFGHEATDEGVVTNWGNSSFRAVAAADAVTARVDLLFTEGGETESPLCKAHAAQAAAPPPRPRRPFAELSQAALVEAGR